MTGGNGGSSRAHGASDGSVWIAPALYTIMGCLYIILSDLLTSGSDPSVSTFLRISILKGLGFVVVSGCILALVLMRERKRTASARRSGNEQAQKMHSVAEAMPGVVYRVLISPDEIMTIDSVAGREPLLAAMLKPGTRRALAEPDPRYHPDDYPRMVEAIRQAGRTMSHTSARFRLRTPEGGYRWILHRVTPSRQPDGTLVLDGVALDINELQGLLEAAQSAAGRAQQSMFESESRLRLLLDQFPSVVWSTDTNMRYTFARGEILKDLGLTPEQLTSTDLPTLHGHPPENDPAIVAHRAAFRGETSRFRVPFRDRWYDCAVAPLRDESGAIIGALGAAVEATSTEKHEREMAAALATQRALLLELDHRVRNSFASLVAMIDLSREAYTGVDAFAQAIHGRVAAMTSVHNLLTSARWAPVELKEIIDRVLPRDRAGAIVCRGSAVVVAPRQATALGMIVHELVSNSIKYGALSTTGGRVEIDWRCVATPAPAPGPAPVPGDAASGPGVARPTPTDEHGPTRRFELWWRESGGPAVERPAKFGLGTTLIQGFARFELKGEIEFSFEPDGVRFTLRAELDSATDRPGQAPELSTLSGIGGVTGPAW